MGPGHTPYPSRADAGIPHLPDPLLSPRARAALWAWPSLLPTCEFPGGLFAPSAVGHGQVREHPSFDKRCVECQAGPPIGPGQTPIPGGQTSRCGGGADQVRGAGARQGPRGIPDVIIPPGRCQYLRAEDWGLLAMDVRGCWQARGDPQPSLEKTARLEHLSVGHRSRHMLPRGASWTHPASSSWAGGAKVTEPGL